MSESAGLLGRILFTEHEIERRVSELGKDISAYYGRTPIVVVGVLKGALFFVADLTRRIETPLRYDLLQVASYGGGTAPQGPPRVILDTRTTKIAGHHVLLVEDIVDTGHTLAHAREVLLAEQPASVRICAFLDKRDRRQVEVPVDWIGFTIPNRFVVGYGLDHAERFRNLPYLAFLKDPWPDAEG